MNKEKSDRRLAVRKKGEVQNAEFQTEDVSVSWK